VLETGEPGIVAHSGEWKGEQVIAVHNLLDKPGTVHLERTPDSSLTLLLSSEHREAAPRGPSDIDPYGYRWYRRVKKHS
jgi:hypothetical protein